MNVLRMSLQKGLISMALAAAVLSAAGCAQQSYPADKIKESLLEICRQEYGIEELDVKITGKTIGVFLPLQKLFAADFKEAAITGKVRNLETLFEPSPEAMEKVEDVLFSISRVLLSTEREFDFYVLEATDIEKTGMQLVLAGYVNDIKRVRVWDISRNEYRKRVIHELKLNRAVVWHKPVRDFFKDLQHLNVSEIEKKYFSGLLPVDAIQHLFFDSLLTGDAGEKPVEWQITDLRSAPVQRSEVLVYAKVRPLRGGAPLMEPAQDLQYLFMLSQDMDDKMRIVRIIPFQFQDESGQAQTISFPRELQIEQNLDKWETEFPLEEQKLGPFLAEQITRRVQAIVAADERIHNTFHEIKLNFEYAETPEPAHFDLNLEAALKELNHYNRHSLVFHEDMLYLLNLASREFVEVLRSYQFGDFHYLSLNMAQENSPWLIGREDLELFRRRKVDLQGLLSLPKI